MNNKEFKQLRLKLLQKHVEMNELETIFFQETGRNYVPQLYLSPVIPKCYKCGEEMWQVESGKWRCDCEKERKYGKL